MEWEGGAKPKQPDVIGNDKMCWFGYYSDDIGLDTKRLPTKAWNNLSIEVNAMNAEINS